MMISYYKYSILSIKSYKNLFTNAKNCDINILSKCILHTKILKRRFPT